MSNESQQSGLQENVAGLLCYVLGWITGIIFLLIDKDRPFVRFHAWQSIFTFAALFVLMLVNSIVIASISASLASIVGLVLMIAQLALWILLMVKAYQGERFKLPVVGDMAESKAGA